MYPSLGTTFRKIMVQRMGGMQINSRQIFLQDDITQASTQYFKWSGTYTTDNQQTSTRGSEYSSINQKT